MEIPRTIDAGITVEDIQGFVSEYEAREAAKFSGYSFREWQEIHYMERARAVAYYRIHNKIEAFNAKAVEAYHNRKKH